MKNSKESRQHLNNELSQLQLILAKVNNITANKIICTKCGSENYHKAGISNSQKQQYHCKNCKRRFVENPINFLAESNDVLTAEQLGLRVNTYQRAGDKLNFAKIKQAWLKELVIKYIRYKAGNRELETLKTYLTALKSFSEFLIEIDYVQGMQDINRSIIINYIDYLNGELLTAQTKNERLSKLAAFFDTGVINDWFDASPYLIRKEDYKKEVRALPRYIPEEVMRQLNQHLDTLPAPIMRMTLVIQECGLRSGELCQLPFDCLKQDARGGWFIQFMRWKMKKETVLPISLELSTVIQEQQNYIRENLREYKYLFCGRNSGGNPRFSPKAKIMTTPSFVDCLKKLSEEFDIRDNSGKR